MDPYQKMYYVLFNAISNALEELDEVNVGLAKKRLREAQQHTEEMYISQEDSTPEEDPGPEE